MFTYRRDKVVRNLLREAKKITDVTQRIAIQDVIDALMSLPPKEAEEIIEHIEQLAREEDAKNTAKH